MILEKEKVIEKELKNYSFSELLEMKRKILSKKMKCIFIGALKILFILQVVQCLDWDCI